MRFRYFLGAKWSSDHREPPKPLPQHRSIWYQVLGRWVRLQRQATAAGDTGRVLDADERAELERLRRENAELRLDREFLKKAAAFFVSEHNR
jgi:transposase-like protein